MRYVANKGRKSSVGAKVHTPCIIVCIDRTAIQAFLGQTKHQSVTGPSEPTLLAGLARTTQRVKGEVKRRATSLLMFPFCMHPICESGLKPSFAQASRFRL